MFIVIKFVAISSSEPFWFLIWWNDFQRINNFPLTWKEGEEVLWSLKYGQSCQKNHFFVDSVKRPFLKRYIYSPITMISKQTAIYTQPYFISYMKVRFTFLTNFRVYRRYLGPWFMGVGSFIQEILVKTNWF